MSTPKEIFLIRHGETDCNLKGIVQGSGIDSELNEAGWNQSQAFYHHYKHEAFDLIVSSTQLRSMQTIEPFITEGIQWFKDERIREISWGEHEGKSGEPELMEKYFRIISEWSSGRYDARPNLGESAEELGFRTGSFLNELLQRNEQKILVCTHGRTLRALICQILNRPLSDMEQIAQSNTGLYRCIWNGSQWNVLKKNCNAHLTMIQENHV